MYDLIPSWITAFILTFWVIPSIIHVSEVKHLFDEPGERASHTSKVPTLGGIGIFAGMIFAVTFFIPFDRGQDRYVQYLLCGFIIIFLVGARDDIIPLPPLKKFLGQIGAAAILVFQADVRLTSMYGILGVYDIPLIVSYPLSMLTLLLIINAFNLIDGINGLSASIGIVICTAFGVWFYSVGRTDLAIICTAMVGALTAFLSYNLRGKIFMGDTGSLLIGFAAAMLAIYFIEMNKEAMTTWPIQSVPAVAIGILIVPLFDTLRVFTVRILRKRSPFHPDRTHVHHLLIDSGLSHRQATAVLVGVNISFILLAYFLQGIGTLPLLLLIFALATALTGLLYSHKKRYVLRQQIQESK